MDIRLLGLPLLFVVSTLGLAPAQTTPVTLVGQLTEQGRRVCLEGGGEKWFDLHYEVGFVRLSGALEGLAPKGDTHALVGGLVAVTGSPTDAPPPAVGDQEKGLKTAMCMPMQMRGDWVVGKGGIRIRHESPPTPGFAVSEIKPWTGLQMKRDGDYARITLTNAFDQALENVKLVVRYEGCRGKPGSTTRHVERLSLKPGAALTTTWPLHLKAGNMRASSVGILAQPGGVIFAFDRTFSKEGIEAKCPRPLVQPHRWTPFEGEKGSGYKDGAGAIKLEAKYGLAEPFSTAGIAVVAIGALSYIDHTGKVLAQPFNVDNGADPFSEGLSRIVEGGKFGYFSEDGHIVISPKFDGATPFIGGRASVCVGCGVVKAGEYETRKGGKWGVIDTSGGWVIEPTMDSAPHISAEGHITLMEPGGQKRVVDRSGKPLEATPRH